MRNRFCIGVVSTLSLAFLAFAALSSPSSPAVTAADDAKKDGGDTVYNLVAPLEAIMEVMEGNVFTKIPEQLKAGKYKDIKREGYFIAEVANLTVHFKEHRGKKEFIELADAMKATALKLVEAADKKDEAAVTKQRAALEDNCDACHKKFRDN